MAVVPGFVHTDPGFVRAERVVEHEMDMQRSRPQRSPGMSRLWELIRWLLPGSQNVTRPPMRSIARELEEVWPTSDR